MCDLPARIELAWPRAAWQEVTCVVAVSGGGDSVALLLALVELRRSAGGEGRVLAAHYNHALRGAESDADEAFVADLCGQLGVELICERQRGDLTAGKGGEGREGAARAARYAFFTRAANRCGARFVATAHTADDQVETVLHRLVRGTGLAGLAGIPKSRPLTGAAMLIRPLLDVTRTEVRAYLADRQQSFREDSSNACSDFTRNRIRHELLPLLARDYNPQVRTALLRLASIAGQTDALLDRQADDLLASAQQSLPGGFALRIELLAQADPVLVRHALMRAWSVQGWPLADMGYDEWQALHQMASRHGELPSAAAHVFPGGIRAEATQGDLQLIHPG